MEKTFLKDENEDYMKKVKEVFDATGKDGAVPRVNYTFSMNHVEYTVPNEHRAEFAEEYKLGYIDYIEKKADDWGEMTSEEKLEVLRSAHTAGTNAAKKWYKFYLMD
jgi:hypothetical protein